MLRLVLGRAGHGKTAQIFSEIKDAVRKGTGGRILIVPEQYSHAAERELCRRGGDRVSLFAEVVSFTRLANLVAAAAGGFGQPVLDDGGRILTMYCAVKSVESELKAYRAAARPAFLQELLAAIDELKTCCVGARTLHETAAALGGGLEDKLADLALLLEAYDAVTDGLDPADRLTRLAADIPRTDVLDGKYIYIDGFTDFTAQELDVIEAILPRAASVTVALTCEGLTGEEEIFENARRTASRLRRMATDRGLEVQIEIPEAAAGSKPAALAFLEAELFSAGNREFEGDTRPVELYTAGNQTAECEAAAARIRKLSQEEGYRWRDFAVIARGFGDYETTVERIFERYEIPCYTGRRAALHPIPLLIGAALETVTGGFRGDMVLRCLKTGLTDITPEELDRLENYMTMWRIRGKDWEREWVMPPGGYGTEASADTLASMNALRTRVATPLLRLRQSGRKAQTGREQALCLYDYLEAIGLPERLEERTQRFYQEGRRQLAGEYSQIWGQVVGALEQCVRVLGESPMGQDEFGEIFRLVLSQYDVGAIPMSLDRVGLGEPDRMRRRDIRCLIVLGATDDRLPGGATGSGVLSDAERQTLREAGLPLMGGADERLSRELGMLYNTFTMAAEKLIVFLSEADMGGGALRPSFLVTRIGRLLGIEPVQAEALCPGTWAKRPCLDLTFSSGARSAERETLRASAGAALERADPAAVSDMTGRLSVGGRDLSEDTARRLFGEQLQLSASRLETYGACHFSYFMRYGLRAAAEKRAELDAPAEGSFIHYILENTTRDIRAAGGFAQARQGQWRVMVQRHVDRYVQEQFGGLENKSDRFRYLLERLIRSTYQIVEDMVEELAASDFVPLDFELKFGGADADVPAAHFTADDVDVRLTGFVDRVDGWVRGDRLYLKIVDYKTGRRTFRLSDIWYGVGMQMLLYLFTLCGEGSAHYGGRILEPAGVLYAPARDVVVSMPRDATDEEIEKERRKSLTRSGVIIRDPELVRAMEDGGRYIPVTVKDDGTLAGKGLLTAQQLGQLGRYIEGTVLEMAREMRSGDLAASPTAGSVPGRCAYCDYFSACQFDSDVDKVRFMPGMKDEDVLAKIAEALREKGGEADV